MRWCGWMVGLALGAAAAGGARADAPEQAELADNWNNGACGLTDTAFLDITAPTHLIHVDLKFHWADGEAAVGFLLATQAGDGLAGGTLGRADCNPTAALWCGAEASFELDLKPGTYVLRTARPGLCQNPQSDGEGFIRAWGYETEPAADPAPATP